MKRNYHSGKFVLLAAMFLSLPVIAQEPDWIHNHQQEYPSAFYLTGVGIDSTLDSAKKKAKAEIAGQVRSTIRSEVTDVEEELQFEGSSSLRSEFSQKIVEVTEVTLSGVNYPKTAQRSGRFYVLAVLDKSRYLQDIGARLENQVQELRSMRTGIQDYLDDGEILTALRQFESLTDNLNTYYGLRSIYNSVSDTPYENDPGFTLNSAWSEILHLLNGIQLQPVSGTGQSATLGEYLPEPIVLRVTSESIGREVPVSGLSLQFKDSEGNVLDRIETDPSGRVSIRPRAIPGSSPDQGGITVTFASVPFPELRTELSKKKVTVSYQIQHPRYQFGIAVESSDGNLDGGTLTRQLHQTLSSLGYTVNKKAPVLVRASVTPGASRQVKGFAGTQYLSEVEATVEFLHVETGEILGQQSYTSRGMSTSNQDEAAQMAVDRLRIPKSDLTLLILRCRDRLDSIYQ